MKTEEMPERIYLEPMHDHQFESLYEWVWIEHPETDVAVEYVRADALEAQAAEIARLREILSKIEDLAEYGTESDTPGIAFDACCAIRDKCGERLATTSTTEETST